MEEARPGGDNELLVHNDGTARRKCLVCAEDMDIAWLLFLQIERCADHGLWFDPGELDRALDGDVGAEVLEQVNKQHRSRQTDNRGRDILHSPSSTWVKKLRGFFR